MEEFVNLYSLSKTLRFELIPQGKTLENLKKSGILDKDVSRAEKYKKIKKIIDEYHKVFIEESLSNKKLDKELLEKYQDLFKRKSDGENEREKFKEIQGKLRKQIVGFFPKEKLDRLFKADLIKKDLLEFEKDENNRNIIKEFERFTTYFQGFWENRKNIYSDEEKSTALSYRIINENLPKFINNQLIFEKISQTEVAKDFSELYNNLKNDLSVIHLEDIFKLDYYSNVLTQKQIATYNLIIGGKALENGPKIRGLNEYISSYNQRQTEKSKKLPMLSVLFKQILSDRSSISWIPEKFENDNELYEALKTINLDFIHSIEKLIKNFKHYDSSKIYLRNDDDLTRISQKIFSSWVIITNSIKEDIKKNNPKKAKQSEEDYEERIDKLFKQIDSFSVKYIDDCLGGEVIENYFLNLGKGSDGKTLFDVTSDTHVALNKVLKEKQNKPLASDEDSIKKIKYFLDSVKRIQYFIKPLLGSRDEASRDDTFYEKFGKLWKDMEQIGLLYNKVRNYVTKKPYSIEKIKINFENAQLLEGWDQNKEADRTCVLLRKDNLYYLAIMNVNSRRVFKGKQADGEGYEKMEYKLLPGPNKMLPKVFFSRGKIEYFAPSNEIIKKYEEGTHKKGKNFSKKDCHALIEFFKSSISKHEEWRNFNFKFSDTERYEDLSDFYKEVEQQGYKITFRKISSNYVDKLVEEGKLYLFQIYNKDFSPSSKGTPNMHTLYWKALFDEENLRNVVYKLNGQAEIFYRKGSIANPTIHPKNEEIENKNIDNPKKHSLFTYDIIKDRRYTTDKFQFHVPITINFKAKGIEKIKNFNNLVNQYIRENKITHIIGIDRGERHLLYVSVIDLNGNILEQFSLNEIINEYKGILHNTDYHALLEKREKEKASERANWQAIEGIKELKEGYISQVTHKITQLMVKYNAVIVLEDLNFGFKRSRQKVEKQVYQKFEKMLIDKLNYLVFKNKEKSACGGLLKAYQLTSKFVSFETMEKQNGFLFYIPAWNTSKIDPVTGFVNLFDTRYINIEKSQEFFEKFQKIQFNKDNNYFEFTIDKYSQFNPKVEGTKENWVICTNGERIITSRDQNNNWTSKEINLTTEFINLFSTYNIDYHNNLKQQIVAQKGKEFFEKLLNLFKTTLQMRNSKTGTFTDYLISPICSNGKFFDSRDNCENLPNNADANGAYNIARKGLLAIKKIKETEPSAKVNLAISNKEWLNFVQKI